MREVPSLALTPGTTRDQAVRVLAAAFAGKGLDDPLREARLILLTALDIDAARLIADGAMPLNEQADSVAALAMRRIGREPLARITGRREFYGLPIELSPATLIPRPDTETLVDAVLDHARALGLDGKPIGIADLGTGSGAILAALLSHLPLARGAGIDVAREALATAERNILRLCGPGRAVFHHASWLEGIQDQFDIIVSNPPYIPTGDISGLEPEVARHDPWLALDGGEDGLAAYRVLTGCVGASLNPGGLVAVEIGIGQTNEVSRLFAGAGFALREKRDDLGGITRALVFGRVAET